MKHNSFKVLAAAAALVVSISGMLPGVIFNPMPVTALTGDGASGFEMYTAQFEATPILSSITIYISEHGTASADKVSAAAGETVTLTITPDPDFAVLALDVRDADSHPVPVIDNQFTMPDSDVTVHVTFGEPITYTFIPGMPATCTGNGRKDCYKSSYGGFYTLKDGVYTEIDLEDLVIPMTGHAWGKPTWNWIAPHYDTELCIDLDWTCSFSVTCSECGEVWDTVIYDVEKTSETPATYTNAGKKVYTASYTYEGKEYTGTREVVIPMLEKTAVTINSIDINGISTKTTVYAETYTDADYTVPDAPYMDGYNFKGWTVNGTLHTNAADVQSAVRTLVKSGTAVEVAVVYEKKAEKFEVRVIGGTLSNGKKSDSIQVSTLVTVKANTIAGKKFSHWLKKGVKVSSSESYSFFMPSQNVNLTAVFVDNSQEVEKVGTAMIESVTPNKSAGRVAFVSVVSVPYNCTMVKGGLVATSDRTIGANVTAKNAQFVKLSYRTTENTKYLKYTWTKNQMTESTVLYVRSYLVYKDSKGMEHTVYSDAVKANINGIIPD